ncbi:MAG TPA: twin-arginine translocase TatA/TatE family subunit [Nitrososphaeraceae archaeon]|nr:twin-arginine translocase TatA/TatE family subunit [Nitrososphaeraceae archaeon]
MLALTNLLMGIFNGAEIILIVVIIAALFFGVKKIPELARSFGKASTEFEKAKIEAKREIQQIKNQNRTNNIDREKLESIADTLGIDYSNKNDEDLRTAIETEINKSNNKVQ